jgi:hypothetical protein
MEICSKCKNTQFFCDCENFHPNIQTGFHLTKEECKQLQSFFINDVGYISHETNEPIHQIYDKLKRYLEKL